LLCFRNDDVNPSTDLENLYDYYEVIARLYPQGRIISGVTLFGRWNETQSVYPSIDLPLKTKDTKWFYNTNRVLYRHSHVIGDIASHGLYHVDHAKISKDAQEMSILGSCNFLGTSQFIAPFNSYNSDTEDVCRENNIELLNNKHDWKSLEFNKFNPNHKFWYFHSWRFSPKQLADKLNGNSVVLG
jgi:hypothetical protein